MWSRFNGFSSPRTARLSAIRAVRRSNLPTAFLMGRRSASMPGCNPPILIADGPETALSVWCATGHETWAALRSLSGLTLPADRPVAVCRDDDPAQSPADKALHKSMAAWRASGIDFRVATPWPIRRGDRTDFNDTI